MLHSKEFASFWEVGNGFVGSNLKVGLTLHWICPNDADKSSVHYREIVVELRFHQILILFLAHCITGVLGGSYICAEVFFLRRSGGVVQIVREPVTAHVN